MNFKKVKQQVFNFVLKPVFGDFQNVFKSDVIVVALTVECPSHFVYCVTIKL